jgi:hypothetical protein
MRCTDLSTHISNDISPPTDSKFNPFVAVGGDIEENIGYYFF